MLQELFNTLPDPMKAASVVILLGLAVTIGLPLTITLWQLFLDRFFPLAGEKFRAAVKSCFYERE